MKSQKFEDELFEQTIRYYAEEADRETLKEAAIELAKQRRRMLARIKSLDKTLNFCMVWIVLLTLYMHVPHEYRFAVWVVQGVFLFVYLGIPLVIWGLKKAQSFLKSIRRNRK